MPDVPGGSGAPAGPPAAAVPAPDPREAALSAAVLRLLEHEHLLRKTIDDDISRHRVRDATSIGSTARRCSCCARIATRSPRTPTRSTTSCAPARSSSRTTARKVFAARVAMVDELVAELLAAPLDHTDEEWLELDPKKVEPRRDRAGAARALAPPPRARGARARRRRWRRGSSRRSPMPKQGRAPARPAATPRTPTTPTTTPLAQIPPTPEGREAKARADLAKTYAGRFARLRTPAPLDAASDLVNAVDVGARSAHDVPAARRQGELRHPR